MALDVESVLESPEFEGFSKAEIALSLSMMRKPENHGCHAGPQEPDVDRAWGNHAL